MNYLKEMAEQGYHEGAIGPFHRRMVPWLLKSHGVTPAMTVMDIGSGQGHGLIPLYDNGWRQLIAVDRDDYNFKTFQTKYAIRTILCNISNQPLSLDSSSVDAILSFHLIEHLPTPDTLLEEAYRVLKPGGQFFIVTPDWRKQYKTFWRDPTHIRPYDKESITRLLRMNKFNPTVYSWNARFGLGRLQAYRLWPRLGMLGEELLAVGVKALS